MTPGMKPWYQVTPFMDSADVLYWAATSRANHGMAPPTSWRGSL